jgi:hypothetical protein
VDRRSTLLRAPVHLFFCELRLPLYLCVSFHVSWKIGQIGRTGLVGPMPGTFFFALLGDLCALAVKSSFVACRDFRGFFFLLLGGGCFAVGAAIAPRHGEQAPASGREQASRSPGFALRAVRRAFSSLRVLLCCLRISAFRLIPPSSFVAFRDFGGFWLVLLGRGCFGGDAAIAPRRGEQAPASGREQASRTPGFALRAFGCWSFALWRVDLRSTRVDRRSTLLSGLDLPAVYDGGGRV